MQKLRLSSEARDEITRCTSITYNKANQVKAPPRGFEAFLAHFNTDNPNQTFAETGLGYPIYIFLALQSVIGMARSFGSIKETT